MLWECIYIYFIHQYIEAAAELLHYIIFVLAYELSDLTALLQSRTQSQNAMVPPCMSSIQTKVPFVRLRFHYLYGCITLINRINTKSVMGLVFVSCVSVNITYESPVHYRCVHFFFYQSM